MDIYVGDKVQIVEGGIDVTNGNRAKSGRYYGENGPLWATVDLIDENWDTGRRFGLDKTVTKVRCSNNGIIVWQVRPEDIAKNIIRASRPESVQKTAPEPSPSLPATEEGKEALTPKRNADSNVILTRSAYVIEQEQSDWSSGITPGNSSTGTIPNTTPVKTKTVTDRVPFNNNGTMYYQNSGTGTIRDLNNEERKSIGTNIKIDDSVKKLHQKTAWQDPSKKRQMLNNDIENIQNSELYPKLAKPSQGLLAAKYNYQIIPGNPKFKKMVTLEDSLMKARASLGIQVHGHNDIAKAVKYYMYNRFKTPDINLAHNKSVTYVFFTRPDLNILNGKHDNPTANSQTLNHSESALIWRRNPELFKLLTDCKRCGDDNNFNLLLSNQVTSFDIKDEEITSVKAGHSWNDYEMVYGDSYTGRAAGEFSCTFNETSDYSIINLIKLWITYIDNVSRGAWSPSYDLNGTGSIGNTTSDSHVYTKTLDYAASAYVFKCGPDGEDVLYWSKYYGVFPMNTSANALSWDINTPIGDTPKLNLRFSYSFKKDLSPISLIEFNNAAGILGTAISENSFNVELGHSSRPYVGAPFIQMDLNNELNLRGNGVNYGRKESSIRLKFRKMSDPKLTDDLLYRSSMDNRSLTEINEPINNFIIKV